jgi:hypothetical protein
MAAVPDLEMLRSVDRMIDACVLFQVQNFMTFYRVALCLAEVDKCRSCRVLVLFYVSIIGLKCIDFGGGNN